MKLILDKIGHSFPGRRVFSDISIEIGQGQRLVITGPNGAGKSTLIKIIGALLTPTAGKTRFEYESKTLTGQEIHPYIGLVAPDLFLYDELTGIENIRFFASMAGINQPDPKQLFGDFGLETRGNDLVRSYSSGMKQRLKYMLALLGKPPLLLLDEPSANLDDQGKALVKEIIDKHDGITVIATNENAESSYADKSIILGR